MLNELSGLSNTLNEMNIQVKEWHRKYKPLPKSTYRIWLADGGSVQDIEELSRVLVQKLRRYGNNQNSFPAFNIAPLYRITDEQHIKEWAQVNMDLSSLDADRVKSWCIHDNWRGSRVQQIERCLHKTSLELLKVLEKNGGKETEGVIALIRLANQFNKSSEGSLRSALETCIFNKLYKGENVAVMLTMLLHKGNPDKSPEQDSGSRSVILDLLEWQKYGCAIASEQTTGWINEVLLQEDSARNDPVTEAVTPEAVTPEGLLLPKAEQHDAFGMPYNPIGEPMPNVKLQGFDVTLRTMFHAQECQYRYGTIDDASYPIAKQNRSRTKGALEWMAQADLENILWKKADEKEIVFVYPDKLTKQPLNYAGFFGPRFASEQEHTQINFENVMEEFIQNLESVPVSEKPENIQVFSLRKMDRARSKVLFSRNCSLEWLLLAAKQWQSGCENIPLLWFTKRMTPFPLQVARIVNNVWKQNGELTAQGRSIVKRVQYYQGLELLLDSPRQEILHYYLTILLANSSGLVSYVGNQHNKGNLCAPIQQKETGLVMAMLGLLLDKSGCKKEDYMEDAAYLMGQILKISDELHALYCKVERDGDVPPRLAGNTLFYTALASPERALAQLGQRMISYIAWAQQHRINDKKEDMWKARWYYNLYEKTMTKLYDVLTRTTQFDDFDRAQVFIGYLSAFPKREELEISASSLAPPHNKDPK